MAKGWRRLAMWEWWWGALRGGSYNVISTGKNTLHFSSYDKKSGKPKTRLVAKTPENRARCCWKLMLGGWLSLIIGLLILVLKPYDYALERKLQFVEGGESYELWKKPPVDVFVKVWLFNVTNADAFLAGLEPLHVEEVGPYVYREAMAHANVTFNTNGTLSGIPKHPLVWDAELSNGTQEDILVMPNIALLTFAQILADLPLVIQLAGNVLIRQTDSRPLVRMTVWEYTYGYKSTLVTLGHTFLRSWINFNTVGLIDRMYNFDKDHFTVFTGETNARESGLFDTYNGATHLPYWEGEHCSKVSGASDSAKYQSGIQPHEKLGIFRKSLCRVMPLVYNGTGNVAGLRTYVYTFEDNAMDNGVYNPDNKCYCRKGKCLPVGLIDATDCYYGAPIAVSYPHFYGGDPKLLEGVTGSKPDASKHRTYYHIVPESGLPIQVSTKFQINIFLGDLGRTPSVRRFSNLVVPCMWMDVGVDEIPSSLARYFYVLLVVLPTAETVLKYLLLCLGCGLLVLSLLKGPKQEVTVNQTRHNPRQMGQQVRASKFLDLTQNGGYKEMHLYAYYSWLLDHSPESDIV